MSIQTIWFFYFLCYPFTVVKIICHAIRFKIKVKTVILWMNFYFFNVLFKKNIECLDMAVKNVSLETNLIIYLSDFLFWTTLNFFRLFIILNSWVNFECIFVSFVFLIAWILELAVEILITVWLLRTICHIS